MNRIQYFKEISDLYKLNDQSKFLNTVKEIHLFICNLSPPLRFAFYIYFLILRLFPLSLFSQKAINFLPKFLTEVCYFMEDYVLGLNATELFLTVVPNFDWTTVGPPGPEAANALFQRVV